MRGSPLMQVFYKRSKCFDDKKYGDHRLRDFLQAFTDSCFVGSQELMSIERSRQKFHRATNDSVRRYGMLWEDQ